MRAADGRAFVSVPYDDADPASTTRFGMYLAVAGASAASGTVVYFADSAYLSEAEHARYVSGELPGGLDDGTYGG